MIVIAPSGKRVFIKNMAAYARNALPEEEAAGDDEDGANNFRKVLELAGVASKEKLVTVDVKAKLAAVGLDKILPIGMWPDTTATRQLATWAKNARKHFGKNAYVYVDFKRLIHFPCVYLLHFPFVEVLACSVS